MRIRRIPPDRETNALAHLIIARRGSEKNRIRAHERKEPKRRRPGRGLISVPLLLSKSNALLSGSKTYLT